MLQKLSEEISDCLARGAEARRRAEEATNPRSKTEFLMQARKWNRLARSYEFAESLDRFIHGSSEAADGWQPAASAPFDRDLELAVVDGDGIHALVFPCRRVGNGWIASRTGRPIEAPPTHWREWMDLATRPGEPAPAAGRQQAAPREDGIPVHSSSGASVSVARGDANYFELVIRAHGEEITIYDIDRDSLAAIGRRLLAVAERG